MLMSSPELDPKILKLAEELLDGGFEDNGTYTITETMPGDAAHPQLSRDPCDAGAVVHEALLQSGADFPEIIKFHPIYLASLMDRRPDAEAIGLQRQKAAHVLNEAMAVRPFDQQG
jgi:hypothetical protein